MFIKDSFIFGDVFVSGKNYASLSAEEADSLYEAFTFDKSAISPALEREKVNKGICPACNMFCYGDCDPDKD